MTSGDEEILAGLPRLLEIEYRELASLTPYELNAKAHSPDQIADLAQSITDNGWTQPIVIEPNGTIIAGHGRRLAAEQLGLSHVPCAIYSGDATQARAYRLFDNRSNESPWVLDNLRLDMKQAKELGASIASMGFQVPGINRFIEGGRLASDMFGERFISTAVTTRRDKPVQDEGDTRVYFEFDEPAARVVSEALRRAMPEGADDSMAIRSQALVAVCQAYLDSQ